MSDYRDRINAAFFTDLPSFPNALCRGMDPDIFFPNDKDLEAIKFAKETCGECVHRLDCLNYAVEQAFDYGIFGGLTPHERWRIKPRVNKRGGAA